MAIEYEKLNTLKYGVYCRKSSDSEDKQVQSIDTQQRQLKEFAVKNRLNVVKEYAETKSAFKGDMRETFQEMLDDCEKGIINAILVIHPSRISRNMTDGAKIITLLDSEKLLCIRSEYQVYRNISTDKFMLALDLASSKKESDDKSVAVKGGQKSKALKGIPHGGASLGFLNDTTEEKGNRTWKVDEMRLSKIKILLDMFLTGTYSAGKLYLYAIEELKLDTVARKRIGGNLITPSRIYEILKDPVYAGFFFQNGERYELNKKFPRLITEEQHNRIKMLLLKKHIPKVQTHKTVFSGFISSSVGNAMGQDVKYQLLCECGCKFAYRSKECCPSCNTPIEKMNNLHYLEYTHYYDVKRKKAKVPYKSISEPKLLEAMVDFSESYLTFSDDLLEWSRQYLHELKDKEVNEYLLKVRTAEERKLQFENKKARSRELLRDNYISPEEYQNDIDKLTKDYADTLVEVQTTDWYAEMMDIFDLSQSIKEVFTDGSIQAKREVLSRLGSNLVWDDKVLSIYNKKTINKLVERIKVMQLDNPGFEPKNYVAVKGLNEKNEPIDPLFSTWLPR